MKAAVTAGTGQGFGVQDVEIAQPQGQEVLVQMKASGLCRSDLSIEKTGLNGLYEFPAVFGHEPAGEVIAVGDAVTDFQVGDRVVGSVLQTCNACRNCLSGRGWACTNPDATLRGEGETPRLTKNGEPINQAFGLSAFAEQMLAHQNQLVKIPDDIPYPVAALLGCGVITGMGAVLNKADVHHGDSVVIVGTGGVGLNAVSGAVIAGANPIIVVDVEDHKLETAKKFGATHVINSREKNAVEEVHKLVLGGVQHVFDFVGITPVLEQGHQMLTKGGNLYIIGLTTDGGITVNTTEATVFGRSVIAVHMGASTPRKDIPVYAELYKSGRINLDDLVTQEIALSQIDEGYEMLKDSSNIRVVITDFQN